MANVTINDLPTANSIDPVQDLLPIYTASATATQSINRNTLLGLASAPVGLTDTQTISGKTLTSPTINGATLSGTLSGTYTIGGTPTFPSSVALLTATQTLTNKTLTSPTINSPTITNASLTADTINGFTTSNTGTIYGVPITAGAISNSSAFGAGVVLPSALVSGAGSSWAWQTWTPTFTNLSSGTLNYSTYTQIGKTVFFKLKYTMSGANVSGQIIFSTPTTMQANNFNQMILCHGSGSVNGGAYYELIGLSSSTTSIGLLALNVGVTYIDYQNTSATVPVTWANLSSFAVQGFYEAV